MRQHEFEALSRRQQVAVLYRQGVYIGKSVQGGLPTVLYQIEGFYIEVYYLKYRSAIHSIRCFDSTDSLAPYLSQIDIHYLVHI